MIGGLKTLPRPLPNGISNTTVDPGLIQPDDILDLGQCLTLLTPVITTTLNRYLPSYQEEAPVPLSFPKETQLQTILMLVTFLSEEKWCRDSSPTCLGSSGLLILDYWRSGACWLLTISIALTWFMNPDLPTPVEWQANLYLPNKAQKCWINLIVHIVKRR